LNSKQIKRKKKTKLSPLFGLSARSTPLAFFLYCSWKPDI